MIATDEQFIEAWKRLKSNSKVAKELGIGERAARGRRRNLETRYGITLSIDESAVIVRHAARAEFEIENGTFIVFSDAHFWDTTPSTAFRGLIHLIKKLKPKLIVNNGDAFDGASISRHGRIGFLEHKPSVVQELKSCVEMLGQIEDVAGSAKLTWPLGNHDSRFETFLAAAAPQYEFVDGFHLKDHFPRWIPCWSTWINGHTVIKHRYKGGIHATHNNTVGSGINIFTGHLHSAKVTPYTDYNGTRYGVDTGTLANIRGDQFMYLEDNPVNWRSGFAVGTLHDGELLPPELVTVMDEDEGLICFRGEVIKV